MSEPEDTVLNISVISNYLLDLESTPPADDACDDEKKEYSRELRRAVLDLHHELEEELHHEETVVADYTYLESLHEHCRLEDSPKNTDEWKLQRNSYARAVLLHLKQHPVMLKKLEEGEWPLGSSREELKEFVTGWVSGNVFTHLHISKPVEIGMVFLPLHFGMVGRAHFELDNIGVIYEYMTLATRRSINGMPIFTTCKFLNQNDWERCRKAILKLEETNKELEV